MLSPLTPALLSRSFEERKVYEVLAQYETYGQHGIALYTAGRVVAFSIGEVVGVGFFVGLRLLVVCAVWVVGQGGRGAVALFVVVYFVVASLCVCGLCDASPFLLVVSVDG